MPNLENSKIAALLFSLAALGSTACGPLKKLDDMKGTTEHMAGTTDHLANQTDHVVDGVENTRDIAESTYRDLRQGNSLEVRRKSIEALERAQTMEAKILEAGKYFMAFEFQLWENRGIDTPAFRVVLYKDAVIELQRDIRRYIDVFHRDPSPSSKNEKMKNLYALAVGLHKINPKAVEVAARDGLEEVTMLSLLEDTLAKKRAIEAGELLPEEFEHELLVAENDLVYMLQLRANFLPAMVLAQVSKIQKPGFLGLEGLFTRIHLRFFGWTALLGGLNLEQLKEFTRWVRGSTSIRDLLLDLGYAFKLDKDVVMIFRNMRIPAVPEPGADASPQECAIFNLRKAAVLDFEDAVKELRK